MDIFGMIAMGSLVTIVVGVLTAADELHLTRLQRRREAQIALVQPYSDAALQAAMHAILSLPDGLDGAGVEARLGRDRAHVHTWLGTLEMWGVSCIVATCRWPSWATWPAAPSSAHGRSSAPTSPTCAWSPPTPPCTPGTNGSPNDGPTVSWSGRPRRPARWVGPAEQGNPCSAPPLPIMEVM